MSTDEHPHAVVDDPNDEGAWALKTSKHVAICAKKREAIKIRGCWREQDRKYTNPRIFELIEVEKDS